MKKDEIVKRLKAAGEADLQGLKAGRAFGRKWAEETANPRQLRAVAKLVNRSGESNREGEPPYGGGCGCELCEEVVYIVLGSGWGSKPYDEGEAELRRLFGNDGAYLFDHEEFAIGFVKGANDVWLEVQDEIK